MRVGSPLLRLLAQRILAARRLSALPCFISSVTSSRRSSLAPQPVAIFIAEAQHNQAAARRAAGGAARDGGFAGSQGEAAATRWVEVRAGAAETALALGLATQADSPHKAWPRGVRAAVACCLSRKTLNSLEFTQSREVHATRDPGDLYSC